MTEWTPERIAGMVRLKEAQDKKLGLRPWVNLTSEEIGEIYRVGWANNMELARAIEAKLKEKNNGV